MAMTPESSLRIHLDIFAESAKDADYIRGLTPPGPVIVAALDEIESENPNKQIRIIEGMGYEIFSPQRIREINNLPPVKRTAEIAEVVDAVLNACVVFIEAPTPKKPFQD